jgi:hypothetical protein
LRNDAATKGDKKIKLRLDSSTLNVIAPQSLPTIIQTMAIDPLDKFELGLNTHLNSTAFVSFSLKLNYRSIYQ